MTKQKPKMPQPMPRPGKPPQTVRGGFILQRRDEKTGRLIMHGRTPYEHNGLAAAQAEAAHLAEQLGAEIAIFQEVEAVPAPARPAAVAEMLAPAPAIDSVQADAPGRRRGTLTLPKAAAPA